MYLVSQSEPYENGMDNYYSTPICVARTKKYAKAAAKRAAKKYAAMWTTKFKVEFVTNFPPPYEGRDAVQPQDGFLVRSHRETALFFWREIKEAT